MNIVEKTYIAAVITALVIATAAAITIAFPSVTVLATPLLGQAAGNNATTSAPMSAAGGQQSATIHIIKDGTNSYVISGSSSSVGSFDTTYRIAGERTAIRTAENLIVSTVVDDFKKSPTIGYVRIANMTTTTTSTSTTTTGNASTTTTANPTLPNPFATPEQITERITNEIRRVISEAENNTSQGQYVEINCGFGMSLEDMRCHYVALPQAGQG
jgi:hypothetical protein